MTAWNFEDLTGHKFSRLTVLRRGDPPHDKARGTYWFCRCDCGHEFNVLVTNLKSGRTKSHGCLKSERMRTDNPMRNLFKERQTDPVECA